MRPKDLKSDPRFQDFDAFDHDQSVAPVVRLRSLRAQDLIEFKRLTELPGNLQTA